MRSGHPQTPATRKGGHRSPTSTGMDRSRVSRDVGRIISPRIEEYWPGNICLRLTHVVRVYGRRNLDEVSPAVLAVARKAIDEAERVIHPRVIFIRRRIARMSEDSLTLRDGPTFRGRCFRARMDGAHEAVCFVATLGPSLDERVTALSDGEQMLEAFFLETAGSLAIQETLRAFRLHLVRRVEEEGLVLSSRLGPGYQDWPVRDQTSLLAAFGCQVPVTLTEECVMIPLKSISGLFGLIPAPRR